MAVDPADAALAAVRRYCGWHVTPEQDDELTLDGPGSTRLFLPTLHLVGVTALTEDGVTVDVADLRWSTAKGVVRKVSGTCWTGRYNGIVTTITHGFDDAPDFDAAVEALTAAITTSGDVGAVGALIRKRVDNVENQWSDTGSQTADVVSPASLLDRYRILPLA